MLDKHLFLERGKEVGDDNSSSQPHTRRDYIAHIQLPFVNEMR
jgi:hypothetical protein